MSANEIATIIGAVAAGVGTISVPVLKALKEYKALSLSINGQEGDPSLREMVRDVQQTQSKQNKILADHEDVLHEHARRITKLESHHLDA